MATLTGFKLIHTVYTHFLDVAFTLLVHCIFYDIYFYSIAFSFFLFFLALGKNMRVSVFEPERFILLSAEVSSAEAVYEQM